ncbi:MAG: hypothetical protein ABWW69_07905 [Pyrodictiaceae archaeon]
MPRMEDNLGILGENVYAKFLLDIAVCKASSAVDKVKLWEHNARIDDADTGFAHHDQ